ncbi:MAG: alpha/beta hydrolase [Acidobacteria bacterium]|nr:alpha/beta hydrolase [Acidobacteriota bacterium]
MELHPDCKAYLEELRELAMPAATAGEVRARYRALCARYAGQRADVRVEENQGKVPCRMYGAAGPVMVWFHGGRMASGDLETHDSLCRTLAARSGRRVLAVDYRLGPECKYPAALEDAREAVDFAAGLGEGVLAGGDSAGAALALLAAAERWTELQALVLIYPMLDATQELASHREFEDGPGTSAKDIRLGYEWWLEPGTDLQDPRVSPRFLADLSCAPRTFVLTAGVDPLRDEGLELVERLRAEGREVEHWHYADHLHGFLTYPARFAAAGTVVEKIARFVSQ